MPPILKDRVTKFVTRIVVGGLIVAAGGVGYSAVTGGGTRIPEFTTSGNESETVTYVAQDFLNVRCTATGGLAKYDTCIVANPLASLTPSAGTGVVIRASLEIANNPQNARFDCGFVKARSSATGTTLIDNSTAGTGSTSFYTTGTALWNSVDFIKCGTLTSIPTTSPFSARLRLWYADTFAE